MIAPIEPRAGVRPALHTGSRVLFLALVCLLAAVPAAGLALTSGAVTHARPDTLPRPELPGLLCRAGTTPAAGAPDRADGIVRLMPAACDLRAASLASRRTAHAGTALSCRAG